MDKEVLGITNESVRETILSQVNKRAFYLLQAGIAYLMYAGSNACKYYYKRKLMHNRALELLQ
jgi:hypothetical protein